jgi:hypothetical protein
MLERVLSAYSIAATDTLAFLALNPKVIQALALAPSLIRQEFETSDIPELVLAPAFEGSESDRIVCYIRTAQDLDGSLKKLSRFRRIWHNVNENAKDKLSLNVRID